MAKKKRRIKEEPVETYEFTPTDFDEREFILKELFGTKVFFIVIMFAIPCAIIWALIYGADPAFWPAGLLICIAVAASFKRILPIFRINVEMIDSKMMFANYAMFLILALGVTILLINAPFL